MTTSAHLSTSAHPAPAVAPPAADVVEVILDHADLAALIRAGSHPSTLPCGRCGIAQGHHRATTDCPAFVRPALPEGYAYADQLVVDQRFRFLPVTETECVRRVEQSTCCVVGTMTVLRSRAQGCEPATHWVDGSLVVATGVEPARSGRAQ